MSLTFTLNKSGRHSYGCQQHSIKVAVFRGTDKTELLKWNEYGWIHSLPRLRIHNHNPYADA